MSTQLPVDRINLTCAQRRPFTGSLVWPQSHHIMASKTVGWQLRGWSCAPCVALVGHEGDQGAPQQTTFKLRHTQVQQGAAARLCRVWKRGVDMYK